MIDKYNKYPMSNGQKLRFTQKHNNGYAVRSLRSLTKILASLELRIPTSR